MPNFVLMATVEDEPAAEKFMVTLLRKGIAARTLSSRDAVIVGDKSATVTMLIVVADDDIRAVTKTIKSCLPAEAWHSLFLGRFDEISAAVWSCHSAPHPHLSPKDAQSFADPEDAWFKEGENYTYPDSPEA